MAIKVTLRKKRISKGRQSLYLDLYPPVFIAKTNRLTRREFLGIYLDENDKTQLDKQNRTEKLRLAERIRQKRENQLNKPEIYDEFEKNQLRIRELGEINFIH